MKKIKFIFTLILIILFNGCSTKKVENKNIQIIENPKAFDYIVYEQIPKDKPVWASNLRNAEKKYSEYELFLGLSSFEQDEAIASKKAEANALGQLSSYIGVYVENQLKTRLTRDISSTSESFRLMVEEESKHKTQNLVNNLILLERFVEKGKYFDPRGFWRNYTKVTALYGVEKRYLE